MVAATAIYSIFLRAELLNFSELETELRLSLTHFLIYNSQNMRGEVKYLVIFFK